MDERFTGEAAPPGKPTEAPAAATTTPKAKKTPKTPEQKASEQNKARAELDGEPAKVKFLKDATVLDDDGNPTEVETGDVVEMRHQKARDVIRHGVARGLEEGDSKDASVKTTTETAADGKK